MAKKKKKKKEKKKKESSSSSSSETRELFGGKKEEPPDGETDSDLGRDDRGPFRGGEAEKFEKGLGEEESDNDKTVFREAPTQPTVANQLRLVEYSKKFPQNRHCAGILAKYEDSSSSLPLLPDGDGTDAGSQTECEDEPLCYVLGPRPAGKAEPGESSRLHRAADKGTRAVMPRGTLADHTVPGSWSW